MTRKGNCAHEINNLNKIYRFITAKKENYLYLIINRPILPRYSVFSAGSTNLGARIVQRIKNMLQNIQAYFKTFGILTSIIFYFFLL